MLWERASKAEIEELAAILDNEDHVYVDCGIADRLAMNLVMERDAYDTLLAACQSAKDLNLRPEVIAWALVMEDRMRVGDQRDWTLDDADMSNLFFRVRDNLEHAGAALSAGRMALARECLADVSNLAMLIFELEEHILKIATEQDVPVDAEDQTL